MYNKLILQKEIKYSKYLIPKILNYFVIENVDEIHHILIKMKDLLTENPGSNDIQVINGLVFLSCRTALLMSEKELVYKLLILVCINKY